MNYPKAYCVRCNEHTDTLQKHTVLLSNNSRALTGHCPKCEAEVYRLMPKKTEQQVAYPDAYCVKCKTTTQTTGKHTVVMSNSSRAMKGCCPGCGTQVYKIMPKKKAAVG